MEISMVGHWKFWYLVFASLVLLGLFRRLDLLALVLPLSALAGVGSWLARRHASRGDKI
jgi:hypothetical protein